MMIGRWPSGRKLGSSARVAAYSGVAVPRFMSAVEANQVMASPSLQSAMFPGVNFSTLSLPGSASSITGPLANLAVGGGSLTTQPAASTVSNELNNLIGILCGGSAPCNNASRVQAVTIAACAAALGNADVLIY